MKETTTDTFKHGIAKTVLGAVRKYALPILLIIGLIIGNLICYNENGRLLKPATNIVIGFITVVNFFRSRY